MMIKERKAKPNKKHRLTKEDIPDVKKLSKKALSPGDAKHIKVKQKAKQQKLTETPRLEATQRKNDTTSRQTASTRKRSALTQPSEAMTSLHTCGMPARMAKKKRRRRRSGEAAEPNVALPTGSAGGGRGSSGAVPEPARLSVPGGFSWQPQPAADVPVVPTAGSSSEDEDDEAVKQQSAVKLSRQERRQRAAAEEQALQERERQLMDPSRTPETADDYERLVVASPDDSCLWIRYMSYFLQATEIEKARGVARRGLKTINFREENEKLNVYVAWLNLESMHGTQETLSNALHEALQSNDTFKVHIRMAEIHAANNKLDEAEQMYNRLVRKLAANKDAWLRYGVFLMKAERWDAARALMQRALRCLDRRDHVEVISKFAQLEFRLGDPERGRTMFDHLLSSYPKRLDQWNVYISQLIKSGDHDAARQIFQRASSVRLSARRMRSLLKRHLEFEQQHGTAEQQQAVREAARQFVENRSEADGVLLETGGQ